jgi:hypothetical protein
MRLPQFINILVLIFLKLKHYTMGQVTGNKNLNHQAAKGGSAQRNTKK